MWTSTPSATDGDVSTSPRAPPPPCGEPVELAQTEPVAIIERRRGRPRRGADEDEHGYREDSSHTTAMPSPSAPTPTPIPISSIANCFRGGRRHRPGGPHRRRRLVDGARGRGISPPSTTASSPSAWKRRTRNVVIADGAARDPDDPLSSPASFSSTHAVASGNAVPTGGTYRNGRVVVSSWAGTAGDACGHLAHHGHRWHGGNSSNGAITHIKGEDEAESSSATTTSSSGRTGTLTTPSMTSRCGGRVHISPRIRRRGRRRRGAPPMSFTILLLLVVLCRCRISLILVADAADGDDPDASVSVSAVFTVGVVHPAPVGDGADVDVLSTSGRLALVAILSDRLDSELKGHYRKEDLEFAGSSLTELIMGPMGVVHQQQQSGGAPHVDMYSDKRENPCSEDGDITDCILELSKEGGGRRRLGLEGGGPGISLSLRGGYRRHQGRELQSLLFAAEEEPQDVVVSTELVLEVVVHFDSPPEDGVSTKELIIDILDVALDYINDEGGDDGDLIEDVRAAGGDLEGVRELYARHDGDPEDAAAGAEAALAATAAMFTATSSCVDDQTWERAGGKDCAWVSRFKSDRCNKLGSDGRMASGACVASCSGCVPAATGAPTSPEVVASPTASPVMGATSVPTAGKVGAGSSTGAPTEAPTVGNWTIGVVSTSGAIGGANRGTWPIILGAALGLALLGGGVVAYLAVVRQRRGKGGGRRGRRQPMSSKSKGGCGEGRRRHLKANRSASSRWFGGGESSREGSSGRFDFRRDVAEDDNASDLATFVSAAHTAGSGSICNGNGRRATLSTTDPPTPPPPVSGGTGPSWGILGDDVSPPSSGNQEAVAVVTPPSSSDTLVVTNGGVKISSWDELAIVVSPEGGECCGAPQSLPSMLVDDSLSSSSLPISSPPRSFRYVRREATVPASMLPVRSRSSPGLIESPERYDGVLRLVPAGAGVGVGAEVAAAVEADAASEDSSFHTATNGSFSVSTVREKMGAATPPHAWDAADVDDGEEEEEDCWKQTSFSSANDDEDEGADMHSYGDGGAHIVSRSDYERRSQWAAAADDGTYISAASSAQGESHGGEDFEDGGFSYVYGANGGGGDPITPPRAGGGGAGLGRKDDRSSATAQEIVRWVSPTALSKLDEANKASSGTEAANEADLAAGGSDHISTPSNSAGGSDHISTPSNSTSTMSLTPTPPKSTSPPTAPADGADPEGSAAGPTNLAEKMDAAARPAAAAAASFPSDGSFPQFSMAAPPPPSSSHPYSADVSPNMRSVAKSMGSRSGFDLASSACSSDLHPLDWSYGDASTIGDTTADVSKSDVSDLDGRAIWDRYVEEERLRRTEAKEREVFRSSLFPAAAAAGPGPGPFQRYVMGGDAASFSTGVSSTTCGSSQGSTNKDIINDILWLERKIADRTDSFASDELTDGSGRSGGNPHPPAMQSIVCRDCHAPPGRLGLVVRSTNDGPSIHSVEGGSALEGQLFRGDLIIAVDNVDTRSMTAEQAMHLMQSRGTSARKITVLHLDK